MRGHVDSVVGDGGCDVTVRCAMPSRDDKGGDLIGGEGIDSIDFLERVPPSVHLVGGDRPT